MDEDDPCVGVCMIGEDGRCVGCGRSEDEIHGPPADSRTGSRADPPGAPAPTGA
ncbi:DUF1289 domain-containing protein [Azospirillum sp. ST 5-10]|uniref:DUF1289 domain-containing protein n=1 Tax=unclassified Azospirillum TaxID=2630922 RepID=UPI003F4A0F00